MILLQQAGVGMVSNVDREIYDSTGTARLPLQAEVTGTVSFKVDRRVDPAAPWLPLVAEGAVGFLQHFDWVPYPKL